MVSDLIYDVGLHNGNDTAYYLHQGFRVVAIEANPVLAARAQIRFADEIGAGRLTILCAGIAESEGSLPFWVNEHNDTWSSFDRALGSRNGTRCREVSVPTLRLPTVMKQHGVPYYLKVDIEGSDGICVKELDGTDLPRYISVELSHEEGILSLLRSAGYTHFKVINQTTFTDSTPLFPDELGLRALRKLCSRFGTVKRLIHRLPSGILPKRFDFDDFLSRFAYEFRGGCSGPFGEDTYGSWHSFESVANRIEEIRRAYAKPGRQMAGGWYDIHATW